MDDGNYKLRFLYAQGRRMMVARPKSGAGCSKASWGGKFKLLSGSSMLGEGREVSWRLGLSLGRVAVRHRGVGVTYKALFGRTRGGPHSHAVIIVMLVLSQFNFGFTEVVPTVGWGRGEGADI